MVEVFWEKCKENTSLMGSSLYIVPTFWYKRNSKITFLQIFIKSTAIYDTLSFLIHTWVILWQLFKIPSFVYMKGKFVTNVSFATVRLINHSWDRFKCLASCFIKYIFFLRLLFPWGGNICLYRHNTLTANCLTFSSA